MKTLNLWILTFLMVVSPLARRPAQASTADTWSVTQVGDRLEIGYGSGGHFPQYAVLHLNDSYLRMNYGPESGWGTSAVILPAFWEQGDIYHQGAPITASWRIEGTDLLVPITGTISSLQVYGLIRFSPPVHHLFSARVSIQVEGDVSLAERPGEAFKPVNFSSMHISNPQWDAQKAFVDCAFFPIPESGWILQPPLPGQTFGLLGGTSSWKTNAPTIFARLDQPRPVTGWVTQSSDPNDDNVGLWAASDVVLPSWSYILAAVPAPPCVYLPVLQK